LRLLGLCNKDTHELRVGQLLAHVVLDERQPLFTPVCKLLNGT
jgi:hypothetical protein